MNTQIDGCIGKRLRAWRKSVPLKLTELSRLIQVSQGSLSDLENDKSLPSATTLANLSAYTDLNIYWLLMGKGPVILADSADIKKSTQETHLYKDFMLTMQDKKLRSLMEQLIKIYNNGDNKDKVKLESFFAAIS
jgi:transcriptional regulator with XRE-family HTH domain